MKCDEVRTLLTQISSRTDPVTPVPQADLDYLSTNGYVARSTAEEYQKGTVEVEKLTQLVAQVNAESAKRAQAAETLGEDVRREHSFTNNSW